MKAITLYQPWASLMAGGYKKNETRSWSTEYRGDLVIHSAKSLNKESYRAYYVPAIASALKRMGFSEPSKLPLGKCLCVVRLDGCVLTQTLKSGIGVYPAEEAFGDYTDNRFAWQTNHCRRLEPIACSGHQQLWNLRPDIERLVLEQLKEAA